MLMEDSFSFQLYCQRAAKGGGKTQGGGKHTVKFGVKTPPQKRFLDPPTYDTSPPPLFLATLCHFP